MNASAASFTLACTASGAHTFAISGGPLTYVLDPNADFTPGETCTVTALAAQVTDQDGNDPPDNMLANGVFSFTLEQAPGVAATAPVNGAGNIATNANIDVTFSEPVNATTASLTLICATSGAHAVTVSGGPTTYTFNPVVVNTGPKLVVIDAGLGPAQFEQSKGEYEEQAHQGAAARYTRDAP